MLSVNNFQTFIVANLIKHFSNSSSIQAFSVTLLGNYAISFYEAGTITLPGASLRKDGDNLTL